LSTLYTIGHSTRSLEEFLELLDSHRIELLADVRRFPVSKRHPHFNREHLVRTLEPLGIGYEHMEALGGRRPTRKDSPNGAWREAGFRGYADYLATPEFTRAFDRLLDVAASRRTAYMCAEAVPWRCHRRLISDALVARGHEVLHILSAARLDAHQLNPNAVVSPDGVLTYPPEQPGLL
jgi:uncharacterized protein (DUF488 family)